MARHLEYLLGENILGLKSEDESGNVAAEVSWPCFLRYEHEIRKQAIKWVNNGTCALVEGLRRARTDAELRMKFLITPLSINVHRSSASAKRPRSVTPIRKPDPYKRIETARAEKATKTTKAVKPAKEKKERAEKEIRGRSGNSTSQKHGTQRSCERTVRTP